MRKTTRPPKRVPLKTEREYMNGTIVVLLGHLDLENMETWAPLVEAVLPPGC